MAKYNTVTKQWMFNEFENSFIEFFNEEDIFEHLAAEMVRNIFCAFSIENDWEGKTTKQCIESFKGYINTLYADIFNLELNSVEKFFLNISGKKQITVSTESGRKLVKQSYRDQDGVYRIFVWLVLNSYEYRKTDIIKKYGFPYRMLEDLVPGTVTPIYQTRGWNRIIKEVKSVSSDTIDRYTFIVSDIVTQQELEEKKLAEIVASWSFEKMANAIFGNNDKDDDDDDIDLDDETAAESDNVSNLKKELTTMFESFKAEVDKIISAAMPAAPIVTEPTATTAETATPEVVEATAEVIEDEDDTLEDQEHIMVPAIIPSATKTVYSNTPNSEEELKAFKAAEASDEASSETGVIVKDAIEITEDEEAATTEPEEPEQESNVTTFDFDKYDIALDAYRYINDLSIANVPDLKDLEDWLHENNIYCSMTANRVNPGYGAIQPYAYENGQPKNLALFYFDPKTVTGFKNRIVTVTRRDGNLYKETYIPWANNNKSLILKYIKTGNLSAQEKGQVTKSCKCLPEVIERVDLSAFSRYTVNRKEWEATVFTIREILKNKNLPEVRFRLGRWRSRYDFTLIVDDSVKFHAYRPTSDEQRTLQELYSKLQLRITYDPKKYPEYGYAISYGSVSPNKDNLPDIAKALGFEPYAGLAKKVKQQVNQQTQTEAATK